MNLLVYTKTGRRFDVETAFSVVSFTNRTFFIQYNRLVTVLLLLTVLHLNIEYVLNLWRVTTQSGYLKFS